VTATAYPTGSAQHRWLLVIGIFAALGVVTWDILAPLNHDQLAIYAVLVLLSGLSRNVRSVVMAAAGTVVLVWLGLIIRAAQFSREAVAENASERAVATLLIVASALIVILVVTRERETLALGRALKAAELDRETERRMLAAASEVSAIGTWSINVDDDRFDWSDAASAMHGLEPGSRPTRDDVLGYMAPGDAERVRGALDRAWATGEPFREEVQVVLPDGSQRWIVKMGEALRKGDNEVARLHGTVQDITLWKQVEMVANTHRNRFSQLASSLPILVWTADVDGRMEFFNDEALRYTGSTMEQLLADQWVSVVHPQDLDAANARWSHSVATGDPYEIDFRIRGADGVHRWFHSVAQAKEDADTGVVRWWGSSASIHAARTLREEADELARDRETILESMRDGVYALDPDFRIVYVNASAETILDHPREELVGRVIWEVFPTSEKTAAAAAITRSMEHRISEQLTYHSEILDRWLDLTVTPSGVGVTVFLRDITEIRSMSERLAQSQRLEAVGQLTGGIAHDFNNLLTVVLGGADALADDTSLSGETHEMAQMIATAAERGGELTHRLLAFARRQPLEPRSINLAERLRGLEALLERTLGEHIALVMSSPEGEFLAEVDPGQYDNALLNLAINARDAMPKGGTLAIEVATATFDETYVTAHAEVLPGTYIVTAVTDSGGGIPQEDLGRLFDPFFTTKEMGQGSGLGLAMVWGFVKQSGGHVTVYSEVGHGSSFKIYLPAATSPAAPATPATPPLTELVGTGNILLAEDDALVRQFATDKLRSRGYEVVEAGSGPEALEALDSMDRVDLLFTDVIMPGGMTGRELADAVLERRPGTPVLYSSGYTENVVLHNGRLDQGVQLLTKPYSALQLLQRVNELILPARSEES